MGGCCGIGNRVIDDVRVGVDQPTEKAMMRAARFVILVVIAIISLACVSSCALLAYTRPLFDSCGYSYADERYEQTRYTTWAFRQDCTTPKGVQVDTLGWCDPAMLREIDAQLDMVGACLGVTVHHCALRVKIAEEQSICGGVEVFPCQGVPLVARFSSSTHDGHGCGGCVDIVEWPATMVVTTDMSRLMHSAVHAITHLNHGDTPETTPPQFKCGDLPAGME